MIKLCLHYPCSYTVVASIDFHYFAFTAQANTLKGYEAWAHWSARTKMFF